MFHCNKHSVEKDEHDDEPVKDLRFHQMSHFESVLNNCFVLLDEDSMFYKLIAWRILKCKQITQNSKNNKDIVININPSQFTWTKYL